MKSSKKDQTPDTSGMYGTPYEPCYLARRLDQIAISIFLDLNGHLGLTPTQYAALGAIRDFPGYEQSVIARLIAVDRTTINEVTQRLSAAGYVERERVGRNISLKLTAQGRKLVNRIKTQDVAHAERFLAPLTLKQREQFLKLLRKMVEDNNAESRAPMKKPNPKPTKALSSK